MDNKYMEKYDNIMELAYTATPQMVVPYCGKCALKGRQIALEKKDSVYLTSPLKYGYVCPECKKEYISEKDYPYIRYLWDEVDYFGGEHEYKEKDYV